MQQPPPSPRLCRIISNINPSKLSTIHHSTFSKEKSLRKRFTRKTHAQTSLCKLVLLFYATLLHVDIAAVGADNIPGKPVRTTDHDADIKEQNPVANLFNYMAENDLVYNELDTRFNLLHKLKEVGILTIELYQG